jgi:hypothetical protein
VIKIAIIILTIASQYSPMTMQRVANYRSSQGLHLRSTNYIAVKSCDAIGEVWWLENPRNGVWEAHQVVDCAMPGDGTIEWMDRWGIDLEISHATAVRWDTVGRGIKIRYSKSEPRGMMLEP